MDGLGLAFLLKPLAVLAIIGAWFLLGRYLEKAEARFPAGRLKRLLFFKVGDGSFTDPPGQPGARSRDQSPR